MTATASAVRGHSWQATPGRHVARARSGDPRGPTRLPSVPFRGRLRSTLWGPVETCDLCCPCRTVTGGTESRGPWDDHRGSGDILCEQAPARHGSPDSASASPPSRGQDVTAVPSSEGPAASLSPAGTRGVGRAAGVLLHTGRPPRRAHAATLGRSGQTAQGRAPGLGSHVCKGLVAPITPSVTSSFSPREITLGRGPTWPRSRRHRGGRKPEPGSVLSRWRLSVPEAQHRPGRPCGGHHAHQPQGCPACVVPCCGHGFHTDRVLPPPLPVTSHRRVRVRGRPARRPLCHRAVRAPGGRMGRAVRVHRRWASALNGTGPSSSRRPSGPLAGGWWEDTAITILRAGQAGRQPRWLDAAGCLLQLFANNRSIASLNRCRGEAGRRELAVRSEPPGPPPPADPAAPCSLASIPLWELSGAPAPAPRVQNGVAGGVLRRTRVRAGLPGTDSDAPHPALLLVVEESS